MTKPIKRVTLEVTDDQHRKLRLAAKQFDITQQDLMGLLIDITLTNTETVRKPIEAYVRKKKIEEEKVRQLEEKTKSVLSMLKPEQLERLLSGEVDLSAL